MNTTSNDLQIHDRFTIKGYDLVASAHTVGGGCPGAAVEVIVLSNNSSHYLVAFRDEVGAPEATLFRSFKDESDPNDDDEAYAYVQALRCMVDAALHN